MNILELVEQSERSLHAADLFYGHGTDNALDEAVFIVFTVLDLEFDCPQEELEKNVRIEDENKISELVNERIATRKPAAYLLNCAWFCGFPFYVNEDVLVPRSPVAELIDEQFAPWINADKVKHVLDIGTGSACIAIAVAHVFPEAKVDAVDIYAKALDIARHNIKAHQLVNRVNAIESDLFSSLKNKHYDIIISNPPYVSDDEMNNLPEEYQHEPAHGLRADDNGLALVRTILAEAAEHLAEDGILIVEVGHSEEALIAAYPDAPFFWFEFERGGQGVFMLNREQLLSMYV